MVTTPVLLVTPCVRVHLVFGVLDSVCIQHSCSKKLFGVDSGCSFYTWLGLLAHGLSNRTHLQVTSCGQWWLYRRTNSAVTGEQVWLELVISGWSGWEPNDWFKGKAHGDLLSNVGGT